MKNKKIIYFFTGYGRSGSTIIEKYLANKVDLLACGELEYFIDRYVKNQEPCSCNSDINKACEIWDEVKNKTSIKLINNFGKYQKYISEKRDSEGFRSFIFETKKNKTYLQVEKEILNRAFKFNTSIIDSSKSPGRLNALEKLSDEYRTIPVLIFRNPCAVCYSWTSKQIRIPGTETKFPIYNFLIAALNWNLYNFFSIYTIFINKKVNNSIFISYEKFVKDPEFYIKKFAESNNESNKESKLSSNIHQIAGNPSRFQKDVVLKIDERWKKNLSLYKKIIIIITTFPIFLFLKIIHNIKNR